MPGKQEGGADVRIHHFVIFCGARIDKVFVVADTHIVDKDIQCAKRFYSGLDAFFRSVFLGGIANNADGFSSRFLYFCSYFFQPSLSTRE